MFQQICVTMKIRCLQVPIHLPPIAVEDTYSPYCNSIIIGDQMLYIYSIHYNDVIMSTSASQITSFSVDYSAVYSRHRSKKTSKLHVTGLCAGKSPVAGEFPAQMASYAENVSIWWRHHVQTALTHWGRVTYICVDNHGHHFFWYLRVVCSVLKHLSEPMMDFYWFDPREQIPMKFELNYNIFNARKLI